MKDTAKAGQKEKRPVAKKVLLDGLVLVTVALIAVFAAGFTAMNLLPYSFSLIVGTLGVPYDVTITSLSALYAGITVAVAILLAILWCAGILALVKGAYTLLRRLANSILNSKEEKA